VKEGVPFTYSKNWMIFMSAMKAKESDRRIHESLYLVIFMNPRAIEAAIICRTIDIIRATSLTII
jgi:hypothetical protein